MRVTWPFYHFFKLQVRILHSLENISIFNIWKLWLVRCDVIFSGMSLILPKMSENFWSKEIPLWWFPDSTLKLNNSRTAWPIPAIYISFSSILNALSYEINLFSRCSSPLIPKPYKLYFTYGDSVTHNWCPQFVLLHYFAIKVMFKAFYWKHFSVILYGKSQTVLIISRGECMLYEMVK